jgi:hypothetical protein
LIEILWKKQQLLCTINGSKKFQARKVMQVDGYAGQRKEMVNG